MTQLIPEQAVPNIYPEMLARTQTMGFTMSSDIHVCSLLRACVSSKRKGRFLELGTGTGLALAWMVDGMDSASRIISIDNDPQPLIIAQESLGRDQRVDIVCADGSEWLMKYDGPPFDLIFADAWPGKYSELNETLALLHPGGIYVIDDMLPQPNWPEGHAEKAEQLMHDLSQRTDLFLTTLAWSTGVILGIKQ